MFEPHGLQLLQKGKEWSHVKNIVQEKGIRFNHDVLDVKLRFPEFDFH